MITIKLTKSRFPREDLTGMKFGDWTVLGFGGRNKSRIALWKCKCSCNNNTIYLIYKCALKSKNPKIASTKCIECAKKAKIKHGDWIGRKSTKLRCKWNNIKTRCKDEKNPRNRAYFKKGIQICEKWKDYVVFKKWALENGYKEGLQIHRKDNNGNYCPENCVWVTAAEHAKISAEEKKQAKKEREKLETGQAVFATNEYSFQT